MQGDHSSLPTWLQAMTREHPRIRSFEAGAVLRHEGEVGGLVLILIQGRAKAMASDLEGREVVLAIHEPGDCIGDPFEGDQPSPGSLVALQRGRCAAYTRDELALACQRHPELNGHLLRQAQRQLHALQVQVSRMALMSVQQRVLALLQDLAEPARAEQPQALREQLTHSEIAARVGCTREMVGRALAQLADEGRILRSARQIHLLPRPPRPRPAAAQSRSVVLPICHSRKDWKSAAMS